MDPKTLKLNKAIMIVPNDRGGLMAVNTNTGNALQISRDDFSIMEAFSRPMLIDAAIDMIIPDSGGKSEDDLRSHVDKLREQKLLVSEIHPGLARHDLAYFGAYQHLNSQKEMLLDSARTRAFSDAITEIIRPDDVVIDMGSGTGILSLFAARAGAQQVHAIERSGIINVASAIAEKNGFGDKIKFHQCMAEDFTCNQIPGVIVSEWLGDFVLRELMFKSFCSVRDRCAGPATKCMPSRVRMYIAPVEDALLWQKDGPGYWNNKVYGFDFSPAFEIECKTLGSIRASVPEASLLSERVIVHDIDCNTTPVEDFYFDAQVECELQRDGTLHGFAGSFDMQLSPSVWLDTGSRSKDTHWQQVFFPLPDALPIKRGDRLVLGLRAKEPENPRKRIPDMHLTLKIFSGKDCIHQYSNWYDKARQAVF